MDKSKMTKEQLLQRLEELEAEKQAKVTVKMTEKGGISVYGLQRFPVTLYPKAWETLLGEPTRKAILSKIDTNREELEKRGERSKKAKEQEKSRGKAAAVAHG